MATRAETLAAIIAGVTDPRGKQNTAAHVRAILTLIANSALYPAELADGSAALPSLSGPDPLRGGLFFLSDRQGVGFSAKGVEGFRVARAFPALSGNSAVDFGDPQYWDRQCPQYAVGSSGDAFRLLPSFRWDHTHQKFNVTSMFMIEFADTPELGMMRFEGTEDAPARMVYHNDANDFIGNVYGWPMGEDAANGGDAFATGTSFVAGLGRVGEVYTRCVEQPDRTHRGGAHVTSVTPKGASALAAHPTFAVHRMAVLSNGALLQYGNAFWEDQADDVSTRLTASNQASSIDGKGLLHQMMPKSDSALANIRAMRKYNNAGDGMNERFDYTQGSKGRYLFGTSDGDASDDILSVDITDETVRFGKNLFAHYLPNERLQIGTGSDLGGKLQSFSAAGQSALDLDRPDDGKILKFFNSGSEVGSIGSVAGVVTLTGWSGTHYAQLADGEAKKKLLPGMLLSATDEMCAWRMAEWVDPLTGETVREPYHGGHAVGETFEEEIEVIPERKDVPTGEFTKTPIIDKTTGEHRVLRRKTGKVVLSPIVGRKGEIIRHVEYEEIPQYDAASLYEDVPAVMQVVVKTVIAEVNTVYPKVRVTTEAQDRRIYGVFACLDHGDPLGDLIVGAGGTAEVLVRGSAMAGAYLESAGGGVARVQQDDSRHPWTLGKLRISDSVIDPEAIRLLPVDVSIG